MKYRVHMSCWDCVERHYYTTEIDGKDKMDAAYKARIEYANSTQFPNRLSNYQFEDKVEESHIHWVVEADGKHLYPSDFQFTTYDCGHYVSFNELCKMIDSGVITVNRDKLNN